ncbi:MAG: hypothetical protein HY795_02260 [Desulfovibrio sp.]|nr:hypothetical protein [Desulfovibrio sp.]MBI4961159.1 hypothetical protein [Desulfovibrio sp.]
MRKLVGFTLSVFSLFAVCFGFSPILAKASVPVNVDVVKSNVNTQALHLDTAIKHLSSTQPAEFAQHQSHYSHGSHQSHASHRSGY